MNEDYYIEKFTEDAYDKGYEKGYDDGLLNGAFAVSVVWILMIVWWLVIF